MKRSATFTSSNGIRASQGIATTERVDHAGRVVFVSRGVTFTPDDLEAGTLAILIDRYGDPKEGAPELLAAAQAAGWRATLMSVAAAFPAGEAGRTSVFGRYVTVPTVVVSIGRTPRTARGVHLERPKDDVAVGDDRDLALTDPRR
jgi:hypothetical protein